MKNETEKLLGEISKKLSVLIKLFLIEKELTVREKIKLLAEFNFSNKEIANILGISEKHVSKEKSLLKKVKEK